MEASIIDCNQEITDYTLRLNNLTISLMSDSPIVRLAFFIQTHDSNDTVYGFNMPIDILTYVILPRIRYTIELTEYIKFNIHRPLLRGALKYQIYIRNTNNNRAYISCPLLEGEYFEIRA